MTLNLERIDWMSSPPLAPDDTAVDLSHLSRATLGDAALEREILGLFERQSQALMSRLAAFPADGERLAHTLKGSARAIGAFVVADAAEALEFAFRDGRAAAAQLRQLRHALDDASGVIGVLLRTH